MQDALVARCVWGVGEHFVDIDVNERYNGAHEDFDFGDIRLLVPDADNTALRNMLRHGAPMVTQGREISIDLPGGLSLSDAEGVVRANPADRRHRSRKAAAGGALT